jgi:putative aldouronate transport system permease protein
MIKRKFNGADAVIYAVLILIALSTLYPFWNVFVISVSTQEAYFRDWYHIIPRSFSLGAYAHNFREARVLRALLMSVVVTGSGTFLAVMVTSMAGYSLSKPYLRLRKFLFIMFVVVMFFDGGLIPLYVLIARAGLRDTIPVLFLPTLLNVFFLILAKNYFTEMPRSLEESARMDGANDFLILFRIIMPSAKPIIYTITLFYAVQFWNDWFNALLYITNQKLFPLAYYLREIISSAVSQDVAAGAGAGLPATIRASAIVITILPIVMFYPFVQRHFVKGIMLGSTKG